MAVGLQPRQVCRRKAHRVAAPARISRSCHSRLSASAIWQRLEGPWSRLSWRGF